jgi:hypothetical protein
MMLFLGKPIEYWQELDARAEELDAARLLQEIAILHAKVRFYESRIADMNRIRERKA